MIRVVIHTIIMVFRRLLFGLTTGRKYLLGYLLDSVINNNFNVLIDTYSSAQLRTRSLYPLCE